MKLSYSTPLERKHQIKHVLSRLEVKGLVPTQTELEHLQAYIDGTTSLDGLMEHARPYAEALGLRDLIKEIKKVSAEEKIELHRQAIAERNARGKR